MFTTNEYGVVSCKGDENNSFGLTIDGGAIHNILLLRDFPERSVEED